MRLDQLRGSCRRRRWIGRSVGRSRRHGRARDYSADGVDALHYGEIGSNNTAIGNQAMYQNTGSSYNIALRDQAGYNF